MKADYYRNMLKRESSVYLGYNFDFIIFNGSEKEISEEEIWL